MRQALQPPSRTPLQGREAPRLVTARVSRHPFAVLKQLHRLGGEPHLRGLMNERIGGAVVMLVHGHVVIDIDLGGGPGREF